MRKNIQSLVEDAQIDFDSLLTGEQMTRLEDIAQEYGAQRRLAIATLARSKSQLLPGFASDPDVLKDTIEAVADFQKHARHLVEIADIALARLTVIGATISRGGHE